MLEHLELPENSIRIAYSEVSKSNERNDSRELLVQTLETFTEIDQTTKKEIQDIEKKPALEGFCLSLSHSNGRALVGASKLPLFLGVDIEKNERVSEKIALRISDPKEYQLAPYPVSLWNAKEGAFKAYSNWDSQSVTVLPEIQIQGWKHVSTENYGDIWTYEFSLRENPKQYNRGVLFIGEDFSGTVATIFRSTLV